MMTINADTKISTLLKHNQDALETIVGISPKFEKLRNPILRKLMAGRTNIAMACRIGGCSMNDFFSRLEPLGFTIDKGGVEPKPQTTPVPEFIINSNKENLVELDVRPIIESGKDPLTIILSKVKQLQQDQVLLIINSFEPTPLMQLLGKQGFESFSEVIHDELVHTYFHKKTSERFEAGEKNGREEGDWDELVNRYAEKLVKVDVRKLEMPLPMHTILEALNKIKDGQALFVYHKRIPVFLLPELEERGFSYRIKEINDMEVHLLIYKE